ncbi:MAG: L-ascorbate 6-phosphate lactonase [Candidatus Arcticimaribacter sp.]|jgi:L-ascorbate 6-phosphate lactonase|tara:strand:- start:1483 stop:2262 length:780 start_codon:yes stop_codon:yes gene_type:complete
MAQDSNVLKQEIEQHKEGVGLWWSGHNGWIIKSEGLVISTDILLNYDKRKSPPPISEDELAELLDISFVTHGHKDHFARSISKTLIEKSKCIFVIPESCLSIAQELKIPKERIRIAKPREPFEILGVKVSPLRAIHGNANFAVYYKANLQDCGYLLEIGGKRFLQPGDSFLLEDHLIQEKIDVLFFSPTEHNMHIKNSLTLIEKLQPKYIMPQHHSTVVVNESTFFWAKGYQKEVRDKLSETLAKRYYILEPGDKVQID